MTFEELVNKIAIFEGFSGTAYYCPAGVLTIGYGRTENVKKGDKTTKEKEFEWLKAETTKRMNQVKKDMLSYGYNLSQNELYALTDFAFNLGCGKIKQLTNNGHRTKTEIANAILLYNKATVNGKLTELKGLTNRRKWDHDLFLTGDEAVKNDITAFDLQRLANEKDKTLTALVIDGKIGVKSIERFYTLISRL